MAPRVILQKLTSNTQALRGFFLEKIMSEKKHGMTGKRNAAKEITLSSTFSGRCETSKKSSWVKAAAKSNHKNLQEFITAACDKYAQEFTA